MTGDLKWRLAYYYMLGAVFVFTSNQVSKEIRQISNSHSFIKYIVNSSNLLDISYILLNTVSVVVYYFVGNEKLNAQRILGSIAAILVWWKLFLWLRLFESTAFYYHLVVATIRKSYEFLIILFLFYMMFGTAFWLISLNRPEDGCDQFIKNDIF